jgi:hypothetical protein
MRRHWTLAAVLGIGLWLPAAAHGTTFTVSQPTDGALRSAVDAANAAEGADTILLPAGTIHLDSEEGGLNVYDELTIVGAAGGSVIDGSDIEQRILDADDRIAALRIQGVTFTGATRGALSFQHLGGESAARHSSAVEGHQLVVTGSTFDDNDAGGRGTGGAIEFTPSVGDASLIVSGSTFSGNLADDGDGFGRGGAISFDGGTLTVENSTFTGNVARGDAFDSGGGAISVNRGRAELRHVTIARNRAEGGARGGGIRGPVFALIERSAYSFVPVTVTNSIVAQNTSELQDQSEGRARAAAVATQADDCDTSVGSGGGNVESSTTCGFKAATDAQDADPGLGPLAANGGATRTMAIGKTSPAFDAAVANACAATDQRGIARPQFAGCDSGAFELAPVSVQPSPGPIGTPGPVTTPRPSCLSSRRFRIRLRVPRGEHVRSAAVFLNGKRVTVRRGRRLTATIDLRGLPLARYRVRIVLKLDNGRKMTGVRRYWTCTPAIHHTRPPRV